MSIFPEGSPLALQGMRTDQFRIEGPVTTAARAWALLGDTDWLNREGHNGAVLGMDVQAQRDGFPLLVGHLAGPAGMKIPFREVWSSWVVGSFFRQVRDLKSPFAARSDYRAALMPVEGGVRPVIEMAISGASWASPIRVLTTLAGMKKRWEQSLASLAGGDPADNRTLGADAQTALARWAGLADPALVERFSDHFRSGLPGNLTRIRAFQLADRWMLPREAVLDTLLSGVEAGATELFWSARCRRCYGQLGGGRLLSDLADHVDCPACGIRTETDLGENVEVLFAPHPSVVTALEVNFCTIYPAMAPAQVAVLTLAPGQTLRTQVPMAPGRWILGVGQGLPDVEVEATPHGPDELHWKSGDVGQLSVRAGTPTLVVHNQDAVQRRLFLTRVGGGHTSVPASLLTTLPRFRRQLSHQVLAPNLRVGVRSITLVFTDLGGSTAMYEELGDAHAYAVVRDHFTLLREIAAAEGGTVVKTIGDAVMAAFFSTPAAVRAAMLMVERFNAYSTTLGLTNPPTLKVGVHQGSVLAVHTDHTGLDYFGGAVNLAARAQGVAKDGDIMLTDAVATHPEVVTLLQGRPLDPVNAALKGLGDVRLWRLRV